MLTTTLSSLGKERLKAEGELEVWRKQRDLGTRYLNEIKTQTGESMARNLWSKSGKLKFKILEMVEVVILKVNVCHQWRFGS